MDAVGIAVAITGGFLLYCAYKGEHPWTLFKSALGADSPAPTAAQGTAALSTPAPTAAQGTAALSTPAATASGYGVTGGVPDVTKAFG
jgi:hypothetical protein